MSNLRSRYVATALGLVFLSLASHAQAAPINVALGKPVTASAVSSHLRLLLPGSARGPQPALSTITDGVFQGRNDCYQKGPYWQESSTPGLTLDINLSRSASPLNGRHRSGGQQRSVAAAVPGYVRRVSRLVVDFRAVQQSASRPGPTCWTARRFNRSGWSWPRVFGSSAS